MLARQGPMTYNQVDRGQVVPRDVAGRPRSGTSKAGPKRPLRWLSRERRWRLLARSRPWKFKASPVAFRYHQVRLLIEEMS